MAIYNHTLGELLQEVPIIAKDARHKMFELEQMLRSSSEMSRNLSNTWDDTHTDHYRTETYTETERDSDGKTRTVTKTRQVYDHTTHTYDYKKEFGELSYKNLVSFSEKFFNFKWPEYLETARKTNADGEYAAESSRENKDEILNLESSKLQEIANTWASGSTYEHNCGNIIVQNSRIPSHRDYIGIAKLKAKDHRYTTHSHSDSGPKEFQANENALSCSKSLESSLQKIFTGLDSSEHQIPELEKKITEYIAVTLDNKEGNSKKLRKEIISMTKDIYQKNFEGGFDVSRIRWWMISTLGVFGLFAGAGIGKLTDYIGDKKTINQSYNNNRYQKYTNNFQ